MILTVRDLLLFLVLGVLLSLSYLTIKYAKASGTNFRSYGAYLFEARGRRQSLASNVGAVFSVTYFFGATFIYGMVFGAWIRIMTVLVFVAVTALAIYVTSQIDTANVRTTADSNLLLAFFAKKLEPNDFRTVIRIFTIIYFALLVEELAVSRLVLHALTRQPIAVAFLLITICFVIYTYLYLGGFRAVVTADSVQIVVLILFLLMLVILMREYTTPSELLWLHLNSQSPMATLNLVGAGVFGISWFMPAVDFYSRLNFAGRA
jgi:Na+/pantothenate symporter